MKNGIQVLFIGLILTMSHLAMAFPEHIPSPHGNYCEDDVVDFINHRFGPNVEIKKVFKEGVDFDFRYWAITNMCDGYFAFEMARIPAWDCRTAQYGSRTKMIRMVWALGECKNLMPKTEYP